MVDVKPSNYIVGIIIFVFMIAGGVTLISELRSADSTYGYDDSNFDQLKQFNDTFNIIDDTTTSVEGIEGGISGANTDFGLFGALNSLISTAWNSLTLLFTSFNFMDAVFDGLYSMFGVPIWVGTLLGLLVTVIIGFAIFSAIFQRET